MEVQILKENRFAELKTEIDVINGTHFFESSVLTENNDLEFVFNVYKRLRLNKQKCKICNKWFRSEALINHIKHHNTLRETVNKCSICGCNVTFSHQEEQDNNDTNISSKKPFKCKVCQVIF